MSEVCSLFHWPTPYLGRRIPKEKFYEHSAEARKLKDSFVRDVERVTWAHRLDSASMKLDSTEAVSEILILAIEARGEDLADDLLAAIDVAIPHPKIFEISRGDDEKQETRMAVILPSPGVKNPSVQHFSTPWVETPCERGDLPVALSLEILYLRILADIVQIPVRASEDFVAYTQRLAEITRCTRERETLERRIQKEKQFNRRIELNRTKKAVLVRLKNLTDRDSSR